MSNCIVGVNYNSFQELAKAYGITPVKRKTSNEEKLKEQQERFRSKHKCRGCGQLMEFLKGTNTMVCNNPLCKGIKVQKLDDDGNPYLTYLPSFHLLDNKGAEIATNIFD